MTTSLSPQFPAKETDIAFTKVALPYGWLGNMSPHPVIYLGQRWPTTEHLFQALRFAQAETKEEIRMQKSPMGAKLKAKSFMKRGGIAEGVLSHMPLDDTDLNNMRMVLKLKIAQHLILFKRLVHSKGSQIIEDIGSRKGARNEFWGARRDGSMWIGSNRLGTMWMELRDEILANIDVSSGTEGLPLFLQPFSKRYLNPG